MKKIYCDICKGEINTGDPYYTARVVRNKRWTMKSVPIDICNVCYNVITDRKCAMDEVSSFDEKEADANGLGKQTRGESEA